MMQNPNPKTSRNKSEGLIVNEAFADKKYES